MMLLNTSVRGLLLDSMVPIKGENACTSPGVSSYVALFHIFFNGLANVWEFVNNSFHTLVDFMSKKFSEI